MAGGGIEQMCLAATAAAVETQLVFAVTRNLFAQAADDQPGAVTEKIVQAEMPIQLEG